MSKDASSGVWQRVVDPRLDWVNDPLHTCDGLPALNASTPHGQTWSCDCGRSYRVNKRGAEAVWVTGSALNAQQVAEQQFAAPHACQVPSLTADMAIGNGSLWSCACGRSYRVNRRGEHVSWSNA